MTLLTVVRDVCAVVGVAAPTSVFAGISTNRTMFEMLACANEMAQRIAYDTRDWRDLIATATYTDASTIVNGVSKCPLPADYKRMLLTSNMRRSTAPKQPLTFVSDIDQWFERRLNGDYGAWGEWIIINREVLIYPAITAGAEVSFVYLNKNCISLYSGGIGDRFMNDEDTFLLDERLLKLGMTYDWKMKKGSPYAEDMGTYQDAVSGAMGRDKPSPIIVGHRGVSEYVRVAYPWPAPTP